MQCVYEVTANNCFQLSEGKKKLLEVLNVLYPYYIQLLINGSSHLKNTCSPNCLSQSNEILLVSCVNRIQNHENNLENLDPSVR